MLASVICIAQLAGFDAAIAPRAKLTAAGFALCTAVAVYLLDRVKLRDTWLDPADAQAHPERFGFVTRHARLLRILMLSLACIASGLGWLLAPWLALFPLVAVVGVQLYAGRPRARRPRPKDVMLLKNLYVSAGITGFAALVAVAATIPGADLNVLTATVSSHWLQMVVACAFVGVRVFADAAICDLDDVDADRRFGTRTLAVTLGRTRAWNIALLIRLVSAGAILPATFLPLAPRLAWAGVTIVSSIGLRFASPMHVRDLVDARFAAEAALVSLGLLVASR